MLELLSVFFDVIMPVFLLVGVGYVAGPRLGLEARTLSRYAYFILVPAFVFDVISGAAVEPGLAARMIAYALLVQVGVALLGFTVGRLMGNRGRMVGAFMLLAAFANVGNFGLPLIAFRYGETAVVAATIYFLAILLSGFVIGVTVASWYSGSGVGAVLDVIKTPAIVALVPAVIVNVVDWQVPALVDRSVGLLAAGMVPTMLVTLGVQFARTDVGVFDRNVVAATAVRLLGGPLLAALVVIPFGLTGIERGAGIVQQGMPAAVLTAIIALEYDLLPDFVTTTVLFSTLASVLTLTVLLTLV